MKWLLAAIVSLTLVTTACPVLQDTARDSIAASKGYITTAQTQHPECPSTPTAKACTIIHGAVAAENSAVDALELYCAGPVFNSGGVCSPDKSGAAALQAALANLSKIITDVKGIIK